MPTKEKVQKTNKRTKLTNKELAFCQEYVKDYNATQAAIRAGYSEKTCYQTSYEVKRRQCVKDWLQKYHEHKKLQNEEALNILVEKYKTIFLAKATDFIDTADYQSISLEKDDPRGHAIKKIAANQTIKENGDEFNNTSVEMLDPMRAGQEIAKLLGLYTQPEETLDKQINVTISIVKDKE